jgi:hypothetical protein
VPAVAAGCNALQGRHESLPHIAKLYGMATMADVL